MECAVAVATRYSSASDGLVERILALSDGRQRVTEAAACA
jgi:hypothetical protein